MDYLEHLISLRIDNDLSQKEVAKIINKSQQGYDHIEKRRAKLAIEDFKTLCEFYNVSADKLLGIRVRNNGANRNHCPVRKHPKQQTNG